EPVVAELQALGCGGGEIEDDAAVLHVGARHLDTFATGIDDDVGGLAAVHDPLIHGPQQVRPPRTIRQPSSPAPRRTGSRENRGARRGGSRSAAAPAPRAAARSRSAAGATGSARWSRPPAKTRR